MNNKDYIIKSVNDDLEEIISDIDIILGEIDNLNSRTTRYNLDKVINYVENYGKDEIRKLKYYDNDKEALKQLY